MGQVDADIDPATPCTDCQDGTYWVAASASSNSGEAGDSSGASKLKNNRDGQHTASVASSPTDFAKANLIGSLPEDFYDLPEDVNMNDFHLQLEQEQFPGYN